MNKIYVNDKNVVECYKVDIDMEKYNNIIRDIDRHFGRGDIKSLIGSSISSMNGKKLDVVAKREISPGVFEFQYYEFIPCSLSRTATDVINCSDDVFDFSRSLRNLFDFRGYGDIDNEYINRLRSCFTFEKILSSDFVTQDLSYKDKLNYLKRLLEKLNQVKKVPYVVEVCSDYDEEISEVISKCCSNEHEETFVKRRIFESLPRYSQIK